MSLVIEHVYFGEPRARAGVVHLPAEPSGIGLVIVPPFGYEAICAHRALRHLADQAAEAGLVAVRVDLDGTGDSEGDDLDRGRLEAWIGSVVDACDVARARGADRVVIAGVRLGAILAVLAAGRRADIAGVAAIAIVPTGKALLREMKMMQSALGLEPPPPGTMVVDGDEVIGFPITPETRVGLGQIDLLKATSIGAPSVLIVDRDDLPGNDRWAQRLVELGADTVQLRLPGYVEMVLDPHNAKVPDQILAAVIEYAASRPPLATPQPAQPIAIRSSLRIGGVTEEVVALDGGLVGVVARPVPPASGRALILLNAGSIRRVGPNRLYVPLARRLAAEGDLVLRLDLSGLGDSKARGAENVVYTDSAIADIAVALAWVRGQGATRVAVAGLCSGAYHALLAANAGEKIDIVIPINPLTFKWEPGMPIDAQAFRVTSEARRYGTSMWTAKSWKKMFRGEVDVRRVAGILTRRVRNAAESRARDALRRLHVPLPGDFGSQLRALAHRGAVVEFIVAASDPGRTLLEEQAGSVVPELVAKQSLGITEIVGPDHTFTPRWSHPLLLDAIVRAVRR